MATLKHAPCRRIVICCDGTWCGPSTGTKTNTKILADSFASAGQDEVDMAAATPYDDCFVHHNTETDTRVLYMPGIGTSTGRGLEGYLIDAVLAIEIKKCCTTAYKFIAEHFGTAAHTGGAYQTRIYLFGHSRGAFTVRSVAGMVRNCGILNLSDPAVSESLDSLLEEVYNIYTSKDPQYCPSHDSTRAFRRLRSHQDPGSVTGRLAQPPVEFMGLLDTVGALGVPAINSGPGVAYEFYDTVVSSDVLHVWQVLAVHDRLTVFTPCHITRKQGEAAEQPGAAGPGPTPGGPATVNKRTGTDTQPTGAHDQQDKGSSSAAAGGGGGSKPKPLLWGCWQLLGATAWGAVQPGGGAATTGLEAPSGSSSRRQGGGHTLREVWMPGSHYDVGRQKFVFLRNVPGWEGVASKINKYLDPLCINITPNKELADLALLEVLKALYDSSTDAQEMMDQDDPRDPANPAQLAPPYRSRVEDGPGSGLLGALSHTAAAARTLLRWLGVRGADVSQDAYDVIAGRLGTADVLVVPPVLMMVGPIGRLVTMVQNVVATCLPIVLADRHIPLYGATPAEFVSTQHLAKVNYRRGPGGRFHSKAFDTYRVSSGRTNLNKNGVVPRA